MLSAKCWPFFFRPYASVTSNHGPRTVFTTRTIFARKAEWHVRRNFTSVLFSWSHQATAPYGLTRLYTYYGLVEWFAGLHGYPVRCTCGHRTGPARESSMFFISYGIRTGRQNAYGAARGPCGPREWTYDFCSKQPGNPGAWCDWGINIGLFDAYFSSRCIVGFDPNWAFPDCNSSLNSPLAMKWCTKVEAA